MPTDTQFEIEKKTVEQLREARERIQKELGKVLVGQHEVVEPPDPDLMIEQANRDT